MTAPILEIAGLTKRFRLERTVADALRRRPHPAVHALNGIDLSVKRGETLGIVGESGSGKSTLARCIVRLIEPDEGTLRYDGVDIRALEGAARRAFNRRVQMVFQDPRGSLNPRMTVRQTLAEALSVHRMRPKAQIPARIAELLDLVRLPREAADRYPHEFSGGQRQRIGIARALSVEPECLIADELVSALDVSVQAQVVNLLLELQQRLGLTVLFVAHDLRLVRHLSHRVAVMYLGGIVETGETEALFAAPRHPYTQALLAAAPDLDPARRHRVPAARGELPSPVDLPTGCPFHPRCPHAFDRCRVEAPLPRPTETGTAACHLLDGAPMPAAAPLPHKDAAHGL
ncbi:ABC transporter ATP-binding protein [Inquilinus sp.]|jgi:oligopeptide/dipeptide ABC transporter ATP-binding protein|uniref:ABC transporter ATP-binding protein n=1 Tax=Inquilinus sp. TaxID=1932117 RepID=UPI00378390C8